MNIKTYLLLIKQSWQDGFVYRGEIYIQLVAWFISFLLYFYLWKAIFVGHDTIGNYMVSTMLTYFFLVQVIRNIVFSYFGFILNRDIQYGDLANHVTKPVSIIPHYYSLEVGRNMVKFLLSLISNGIILLIFWEHFDFSTMTASSIGLGAISMIPAHFINFCFVLMIGSLAFWITDSNRLIYFYFAFVTLAGGWVVPLDLFPEPYYTLIMYTPFPYTFYFSVKLLQGGLEHHEIIRGFAIQLSYCVIVGAALTFQMHRGLKRFDSVGR